MDRWDSQSSTRERLYLLTRIGNADPSPWMYNSHSDRWSNGFTGFKVGCEASESLKILADRGLSESTALELIR